VKSLFALAVLLVVGLAARPAAGQVSYTFDENGHGSASPGGTLTFTTGPATAPLTYFLGYATTPGDILITEPPNNNILSDLLRFDNAGHVTVFSETDQGEAPDLADVPALPNAIQPFIVEPEAGIPSGPGLEGSPNGLIYTPGVGSGFPGAPTSGPAVTINFISDTPEPASALLISGLGFALLVRRPRQNA
jgi:hypothetical protein